MAYFLKLIAYIIRAIIYIFIFNGQHPLYPSETTKYSKILQKCCPLFHC